MYFNGYVKLIHFFRSQDDEHNRPVRQSIINSCTGNDGGMRCEQCVNGDCHVIESDGVMVVDHIPSQDIKVVLPSMVDWDANNVSTVKAMTGVGTSGCFSYKWNFESNFW